MNVVDMTIEQYEAHLIALDPDLLYGQQYNSSTSVRIESMLATIPGANDERNWHWLVKLVDGRFAYITGGCDYTGWDCQSSLDIFEEETLELALRRVGDGERDVLEAQAKAVRS